MIWEEATIEHPLSTHSASIGTRWSQAGYLHALRMCAVLFVMLFSLGVGNVWGLSVTYTTSSGSPSASGNTITGSSASFSDDTYNSNHTQMLADGSMELTLTSLGGINISNISLSMKSNKKAGAGKLRYSTDGGTNWTYLVGSSSEGVGFNQSAWHGSYSTSYVDIPKTVSLSSVSSLKIKIESTVSSIYCQSFTITYTAAAPSTTVTPDPTSITFDDDELDGSGEASGSTTLDISVSNGYQSGGNYLFVAVESDDTECEFTVNSGAYSYGSGNSTSIDDLSVEYYAIDAGTFTGRVIASGYNSSYTAVNCTIPLSVTITAGCSYQVALTKGAQTNGSFSLSESNGSYDNCDANFVVTVSSISPSSGYGCTGVTATGSNSTVTGPDGSGNYTVTYTKGNSITSTVTANFAEKVKTPTFGVSGGTYNATQSVTLSCATDGATIYYTTDGSTPTTSSSVYSSAISVTTTNTTIKAIAAKSSMANSDVASATYVLKCATPEISPVTGSYTGAQNVTITCATDGASIYYTNNGGTPSSSSTSYSAFSLDATKTIKAIAIKSGWTDSEIATSTITVQYGITWKVNGETWTPKTTTGSGTDGSSLVNSGTQWSALTLPTDPDPDEDGCGQKFIGWITNTITGELDKTDDAAAISALDILNSGNQSGKTSETITTGTTFHAVFADYAE